MYKYPSHQSIRYINTDVPPKNPITETKKLPELYDKRENCCGCSACFAICPTNSIKMEADEEGFLYPTVDAKTCIRCYKCISVCVFKDNQKNKKLF